MAWDKGFDFRSTSAYVTDPANCTYVIGDTYPVTRNGATFGWTSGATVQTRNRSTGVDARLAGVNWPAVGVGGGNFQVDLPATGDYTFYLALGDASFAVNADKTFQLLDNATPLVTFTNWGAAAGSFRDATNTEYTAANWPGSNTGVTKTFSTTTLVVFLSGAFTGASIAHLFLSQVSAGGSTWPGYQSPFGWH